MMTIIGSVIGFLTSFLPEIIKIFKQKSANKHDVAMLEKQIELEKLKVEQKMQEVEVAADSEEIEGLYKQDSYSTGVKFIDGLRGSVRPIITYSFFLLFVTVKITHLIYMLQHGAPVNAISSIWDSESQTIFAAVISFWFGQRAINNAKL